MPTTCDKTVAAKFERLCSEYAAAKAKADSVKEELDRCRAVMDKHNDVLGSVRDDIYARIKKLRIGVGASIHTSKALLTLSDGPLSVEVLDINRVPDDYIRQPEPQVNKADVLRLWRERSKKVPGTRIVIGDPVLSIRL